MSDEIGGPTGTLEDPKVLIIDDEREIHRFLQVSLVNHGFRPVKALTGHDGLRQVARERPDLVLLDLGLPDLDGMEVIRELRKWSKVPVIVLTACGRDAEKVTALNEGADDYVTKPFSVSELVARIRVALRHAAHGQDEPDPPVFTVDLLRVDFARRQVFVADKEVHLTPTEYRLLTTLVKHSGRVVTHRQLLTEVWGPDSALESNYLRVYMTQLRRKIEPDQVCPRLLLTEPGVGYRLISPTKEQDGARKN
jgi:two-component system, OmpR family, KDP operon response regulator KdpE